MLAVSSYVFCIFLYTGGRADVRRATGLPLGAIFIIVASSLIYLLVDVA